MNKKEKETILLGIPPDLFIRYVTLISYISRLKPYYAISLYKEERIKLHNEILRVTHKTRSDKEFTLKLATLVEKFLVLK